MANDRARLLRRGARRRHRPCSTSALEESLAICARQPHERAGGASRASRPSWSRNGPAPTVRPSSAPSSALVLGRRLRRPEMIIFTTWFLGKARCCIGDYGGAISAARGRLRAVRPHRRPRLEEPHAEHARLVLRRDRQRSSARASTTNAPPRWRARSAIPRSSPTPTSTSPSITSRSATASARWR